MLLGWRGVDGWMTSGSNDQPVCDVAGWTGWLSAVRLILKVMGDSIGQGGCGMLVV
jgi:hypothetical protein